MFNKYIKNKIIRNYSVNKEMVNIFVNDEQYEVEKGLTIFQACQYIGITIPRFCYHERLAVAGNCRMCLVEVENAPKLMAACAAQVMPNMKIKTSSEKTRVGRGNVMEFLLANHPLDCPICDQGGECDLQDISEVYGFGIGRFNEYKRAVEDKNVGPLISTIMNRCIHCTRCVRFSEEYMGEFDLGTCGRGKYTEIGTYIEKMITHEMSGNLVDLCPVGALTNAPYAFTTRPWELKSMNSIDITDSLCSNIQIDYRGGEVMRVLPKVNELVNEEWISDKGRYSYDGLKRQRLTYPLYKDHLGEFKELNWEETIQIIAKKINLVTDPNQIGGIIGEFVDCESILAFKDLMNRLGVEDLQTLGGFSTNADFRSNYLFNSQISNVEDSDFILIIGTNTKSENPIINSKIMRGTKNNGTEVCYIGGYNELGYNFKHLGNDINILRDLVNNNHPVLKKIKSSKFPMIILGTRAVEEYGSEILELSKKLALKTNIINEELGWNGFNLLHKDSTRPGALDLGITKKNINLKDKKLLYILNADNIDYDQIPKDTFVIYQGTHGDKGAYNSNIILPTSSFMEKTGTYVNTEGRVQLAKKAVGSPNLCKNDWEILRVLSEELGVTLPYDTLEELRYRMAEVAPHLLKYNHIEDTIFSKFGYENDNFNNYDKNENYILADLIDDYYKTDQISRSSLIMSKCSAAFNKYKFTNFKKRTFK